MHDQERGHDILLAPSVHGPVPIGNAVTLVASCVKCKKQRFAFEITSGEAHFHAVDFTTFEVVRYTPGIVTIEAADEDGHLGNIDVEYFGVPKKA